MKTVAPVQLPIVTSLPAAGNAGSLVVLSSDMHVYHDNGSTWDDLTAQAAGGGGTTLGQDYASNRGSEMP